MFQLKKCIPFNGNLKMFFVVKKKKKLKPDLFLIMGLSPAPGVKY